MGDEAGSLASVQDLRALDRDVARGVALLAEWRATIAKDAAAAVDDAPLEPVRRVAGQSTWLALERLDASQADLPLRDALRQWVYYLLQARLDCAGVAAWARAAAKMASVDLGEVRKSATWREAWRGAVAASSAPAARPWLEAAASLAPELASIDAHRASRRVEAARRLGLAHPWTPLVSAGPALLRETAERFLGATDDLWSAAVRDVLRDGGGAAAVLVAVTAREAGEGWPARLNAASLRDLLPRAFDEFPVALPVLPTALGAASFARAMQILGFELRVARRSTSVPFALAREPAFVAAHRQGFVVGSLAADPVFQARALGLSRRASAAQARALARTALFEARLSAVRLLAGDDAAFAPRDLVDELTARLFDRSLDPRFVGAWPRVRDDEPARWLALLQTRAARDSLRDRFDADWFRNPRAWQEMREATLAREPVDEEGVRGGAAALAQAFEGALA
jgi:hypothetical protein